MPFVEAGGCRSCFGGESCTVLACTCLIFCSYSCRRLCGYRQPRKMGRVWARLSGVVTVLKAYGPVLDVGCVSMHLLWLSVFLHAHAVPHDVSHKSREYVCSPGPQPRAHECVCISKSRYLTPHCSYCSVAAPWCAYTSRVNTILSIVSLAGPGPEVLFQPLLTRGDKPTLLIRLSITRCSDIRTPYMVE